MHHNQQRILRRCFVLICRDLNRVPKKNSTDPKIKEAKLSYSPTETEQMDENITLFSQENK